MSNLTIINPKYPDLSKISTCCVSLWISWINKNIISLYFYALMQARIDINTCFLSYHLRPTEDLYISEFPLKSYNHVQQSTISCDKLLFMKPVSLLPE